MTAPKWRWPPRWPSVQRSTPRARAWRSCVAEQCSVLAVDRLETLDIKEQDGYGTFLFGQQTQLVFCFAPAPQARQAVDAGLFARDLQPLLVGRKLRRELLQCLVAIAVHFLCGLAKLAHLTLQAAPDLGNVVYPRQ